LRAAARQQEDNLGSLHLLCSPASGSDPLFKSSLFRWRKNQSFGHTSLLSDHHIRSQCHSALV
jgi:hypothetical protein